MSNRDPMAGISMVERGRRAVRPSPGNKPRHDSARGPQSRAQTAGCAGASWKPQGDEAQLTPLLELAFPAEARSGPHLSRYHRSMIIHASGFCIAPTMSQPGTSAVALSPGSLSSGRREVVAWIESSWSTSDIAVRVRFKVGPTCKWDHSCLM